MKITKFMYMLTFALAISMATTMAQPGGGGGMGGPGGGMGGPGGGMGGPPTSQSIDPVAMTGYFEIDVEKAIKRSKVKEEAEKSAMRHLFAEFHKASAEVFIAYPTEFQNLELMKETMESAQMGGMDDSMRANMREMMSGVAVIKKEMTELHNILKAGMKQILASNEKSLKRWDLYYADICDTNNFSDRQRQRGGQGGQGGQGGRPDGPPSGGMEGGMGGF